MITRPLTQEEKDTQALSKMMLARVLSFFCSNLPICIVMIADPWDIAYNKEQWQTLAAWSFIWACFNFLINFNLAINFFIFICVAKFRREFVTMMLCRKPAVERIEVRGKVV